MTQERLSERQEELLQLLKNAVAEMAGHMERMRALKKAEILELSADLQSFDER